MKILVMTIALGAMACGSDGSSAIDAAPDDAVSDGATGDGPCVQSPAGARARWRAENDAVDSVGNFTSTVVGAPGYAASRSGVGFTFDGNDAIKVDDNEMLWPSGSFTVEAWAKAAPAFTGTGIFMLKYACSDACPVPNDKAYYALYMVSGAPAFDIRSNSDTDILKLKDTTLVVNDDLWHHIVGVRDNNAGQLLLYVDGALRTMMTLTPSQLMPMSDLDTNLDYVVLGAATTTGGTALDTYFTGAVDDVAFYNRALSAAEISSIYAAPEGICR